jgi:Zn-dependent M16 (insulinase) family peptidase
LNFYTGGFSTFTDVYLEENSDNNLMPMFIFNTRSMNSKIAKMFELTSEVINNTIYDDPARLREVLVRHQSQLDASLKRNGLGYARTRMTSYLTQHGQFNERTEGYEYYKFIKDITSKFEDKSKEIIENLTKTASLLFLKDNLIVAMTGSSNDLEEFRSGLKVFLENHPSGEMKITNWNFGTATPNEGLLTASKVQYVLQGFDFKKHGFEWNGKMRVLNQILSRDWLTKQIRIIGGAYGGFSSFVPSGVSYFGSYRDPNLRETLKNYQETNDYLETFKADSLDMIRYIIGTIARLDRPRTPMQQGIIAFRNYFERITKEELQKERNEILTTTSEDIKNMQPLIAALIEQNTYCVYGNETKLKKNKDLFSNLIQID